MDIEDDEEVSVLEMSIFDWGWGCSVYATPLSSNVC